MSKYYRKIFQLVTIHKSEVFLCLFILFTPLLIFITNVAVNYVNRDTKIQNLSSIETSFNNDLKLLLENTQKVVGEGEINKYIANNDSISTHNIFRKLTEKYNFYGMAAVNKEGVTVARVPVTKTGDYAAQTTSWGRRAARGESVVTIGVGGIFPLAIASAVPIYKNNQIDGAIYAGYVLDNAYAVNFKKKNLKTGEQLLFYSKTTGVYGDSFEKPEISPLLKSYFNNGTYWVQNGRSELDTIRFRLDGKVFHIGNIRFNDIDGNFIGGMLIFYPVNHYIPFITSGIVSAILLCWVIFHVLIRHRKNRLHQIGFPVGFFIVLFFSFLLYNNFIHQNEYSIVKFPYTIYNSTITLDPESDLFNKTTTQNLTIRIATGGNLSI